MGKEIKAIRFKTSESVVAEKKQRGLRVGQNRTKKI
jgi:hypothetical protein